MGDYEKRPFYRVRNLRFNPLSACPKGQPVSRAISRVWGPFGGPRSVPLVRPGIFLGKLKGPWGFYGPFGSPSARALVFPPAGYWRVNHHRRWGPSPVAERWPNFWVRDQTPAWVPLYNPSGPAEGPNRNRRYPRLTPRGQGDIPPLGSRAKVSRRTGGGLRVHRGRNTRNSAKHCVAYGNAYQGEAPLALNIGGRTLPLDEVYGRSPWHKSRFVFIFSHTRPREKTGGTPAPSLPGGEPHGHERETHESWDNQNVDCRDAPYIFSAPGGSSPGVSRSTQHQGAPPSFTPGSSSKS